MVAREMGEMPHFAIGSKTQGAKFGSPAGAVAVELNRAEEGSQWISCVEEPLDELETWGKKVHECTVRKYKRVS